MKLLKAIENLTNAVNRMGDMMAKSFENAGQILKGVGESASSTGKSMGEAANEAQRAGEGLASGAERASGSMSSLEKEIGAINSGLESVSRSAETGFSSGKAVLTFDNKLRDLEDRIASAKERLEEFGNTQIPTAEYQELAAQIQKVQERISSAQEKLAEYNNTAAYIREHAQSRLEAIAGTPEATAERVKEIVDMQNRQFETLNAKIAEQRSELQGLETEYQRLTDAQQSAFQLGSSTEQFARMTGALDEAQDSLNRNKALIDQEALAQARLNVLTAQEAVQAAKTTAERERAIAALKAQQAALAETAGAMAGQTPKAPSLGDGKQVSNQTGLWKALGSAIQNVGKHALTTAGNLAKIPFQAFSKSITGFTSKLKSSVAPTNQLVKSLTSLKRLLLTWVKRMFISAIFSGVRDAIKSLAEFSSKFNASMSEIQNGAKQISGNLAVTFSGLVNTLQPIVSRILSLINSLVVAINTLFAILGGKNTMTVAKKQTDAFAQSLGGAGGAAKDATKQLLPFDEIVRQEGEDAGGGGGGAGDLADMFEEVAIDAPDFSSWGKALDYLLDTLLSKIPDLEQAFLAFDEKIRDFANNLYEAFTFPGIKEKVQLLGRELAGAFNTLTENFPWSEVGHALGAGLELALTFLDNFIYSYHWDELGAGLARMVNGIVEEIDGRELGQLLWAPFKIALETVAGFLDNLSPSILGPAAGNTINGFFEEMDKTLDRLPSESIGRKIGTFLEKAIGTVDFGKIGSAFTKVFTNIGDVILGVLESNFIGEVGTAIGEFLRGALKEGKDWLDSKDWKQVGENIKNSFISFIENLEVSELAKGLFGFISSALIALADLATGIDPGDVVSAIFDVIAGVIRGFDPVKVTGAIMYFMASTITQSILAIPEIIVNALAGVMDLIAAAFESVGLDGIAGFFKGISGALKDVGAWLKEHLVDPVVNWVKKLFGIHSPSTVFAEIGDALIQGLFKGIADAWHIVTDFFERAVEALKSFFSDAWSSIKNAAVTAWNSIKSTATNIWNGLKSFFEGLWNSMKETATKVWNSVKDFLEKTWENLKKTAETVWNAVKDFFSKTWENIKKTASEMWEKIKTDVTAKFEAAKKTLIETAEKLRDEFSKKWETIKTEAGKAWEALKTDVSKKFEEAKTKLVETAGNIKTDVAKKWDEIKSEASEKWEGIKTTVSSLWDSLHSLLFEKDWSDVGANLVNGIKNGLTNMWGSLSSAASNMASSLSNTVRGVFRISSPSKVWAQIGEYLDLGLKKGIEDEESSVLRSVKSLASAVSGEMEQQSRLSSNASGISAAVSGFSDRIADGVFALVDTLQAIADNVTFRVPNIAAGTVLPYKVAAAANAPSTSEYAMAGSGPSSYEIAEAFRQALMSSGAGNRTIVLQIGQREAGRMIVDLFNQESRRVGVRLGGA